MSSLPNPALVAAMPPRISGTFCRMRWFLRYARGEARLCHRPNPLHLER